MDTDSPLTPNAASGGVESQEDLESVLLLTEQDQHPQKFSERANLQTTLLEPPPLEGAAEICSFSTDASASVEKGRIEEEGLKSKFFSLLDSGSTAKKAANDLKVDKRLSGILEREYQQLFVKEFIGINLIPPKAEAALIKAGRQKGMREALRTEDYDTFGKLAKLAIADPTLAMQKSGPAVVINVGDVKRLVDEATPVEVEFEEDVAPSRGHDVK